MKVGQTKFGCDVASLARLCNCGIPLTNAMLYMRSKAVSNS